MEVEISPAGSDSSPVVQTGVASYFHQRAERLAATIQAKKRDLFRLQAQRNELNSRVRLLRDELQVLQEPGSHVGEVVRPMGKTKVLVKVWP